MYGELYTLNTLKVSLFKKYLFPVDGMKSNWDCLLLLKNAMKTIICQRDLQVMGRGNMLQQCLLLLAISANVLISPHLVAEQSPTTADTFLHSSECGKSCSSTSWPFWASVRQFYLWTTETLDKGLGISWVAETGLLATEAFLWSQS